MSRPSESVTDVRVGILKKAKSPSVVTEFGIVTELRDVDWNAKISILVRPSERVTDVRDLILLKELLPNVVTEAGKLTVVRAVCWKA